MNVPVINTWVVQVSFGQKFLEKEQQIEKHEQQNIHKTLKYSSIRIEIEGKISHK